MKLSPRMLAATLAATVFASGLVMAGTSMAKNNESSEKQGYEHKGSKRSYEKLTAEKQAQYDSIMKDFAGRTQPLRDKMEAKQLEIAALGQAPVVDAKAVGKATEELVTMRNEMRTEWNTIRTQVAKEVGIDMTHPMKKNRNVGKNRADCGCKPCIEAPCLR